jgi:phosphate transport system substrate-binding protein
MKTRSIRIVSVLAAAGAITAASASIAVAVPPSDGQLDQLTLVGSDTTQDVMGAVSARWNADALNPAPKDFLRNVKAFGGGTVTVPGDNACGAKTWAITPTLPTGTQEQAPTGSGAGKARLTVSVTANDGCVDIARSSSARGATDPASFEYYAFARDALSWAAYPGAAPASHNLTLANLRAIYNCTKTNWNQVGGANQPIQRYIPQAGSGTRNFFISNILGFDPSTISTANCPAVNQALPENDGSQIPAAQQPAAILAYSAAQWISQGNKKVTDLRGGTFEGLINNANPVVTNANGTFSPRVSVYGEASTFVGARYVFNVLDNTSRQYTESRRAVGFILGGGVAGASQLCAGIYAGTIRTFGFLPLPKDAAGLTCRKS